MEIDFYQIDSFADHLFSGNPAAVCPLPEFLSAEVMQSIAAENNLSETAFFIRKKEDFEIRWFTPEHEVDLCGHATLAGAYVIFNYIDKETNQITFHSKSGPLHVKKIDDGSIQLDFPAIFFEPTEAMKSLNEAFGMEPKALYKSKQDFLAIFEKQAEIESIRPDFNKLLELDLRGVIVSSPSNIPGFDFVSRFFAPKFGVPEDPVTGSAHCTLTPYWAKALGKTKLKAKQLSKRGGEILCELNNDRVLLTGKSVTYMKGKIEIKDDLLNSSRKNLGEKIIY